MRILVLIPAYNEIESLPGVVTDVRAQAPTADILVVDDGSDDDTRAVLPALGVRWLRLPVRMGTGGAVRAGLRYAVARNFDVVVRLDGDGQHPAPLIAEVVAPIANGAADVVVGSRYAMHPRPKSVPFARRLLHYLLGRILSRLAGRLITDPTSGLWAFNRTAIEVLAVHHPSGYPEPELMLFVSRNGLRTLEVPVEMRQRTAGASSLTIHRTSAAMLRLLILLAVAPLRGAVKKRP